MRSFGEGLRAAMRSTGSLLILPLVLVGACDNQALQAPVIVAQQPGVPLQLALDATNVYWLSAGGENIVLRYGRDDGAVETLVEDAAVPGALVIDGTDLLYTTTGGDEGDSLWRVGTLGGGATRLAAPTGAVSVMRPIPSGGAVWATVDGRLERYDGSAVVTMAELGTAVGDLGVDGSGQYAYWTEPATGTVSRIVIAGGTPEPLSTGLVQPRGLWVGPTGVFVSVGGDSDEASAGGIVQLPLGGSADPPATIIDDAAMAAGGRFVEVAGTFYWLEVDGGVHRLVSAPVTGGVPTELTEASGSNLAWLAGDTTAIYWAASDGAQGVLYEHDL